MHTVWQDIRQGLRVLGAAPGFAVTIILTLGLGIGANAAVFSIVNTLLLRPLPVTDPARLHVLSVTHQDNQQPHQVSWGDYVDYRNHAEIFSDLAAYAIGFAGLSADKRAERIAVNYVTGNYFPMLGLSPHVGRLILPSEGQTFGADPVVVLGHSYWRRRFNADPTIVGRAVLVNGQPFTVVGVVPEKFTGTYALIEFDAYMPIGMVFPEAEYRNLVSKRDNHELRVIGRLASGVPLRQAQAALDVVARALEHQYPDTNKTVRARLIKEQLARPEPNSADSLPFVAGVFMLLVGLVLIVASVNVVNLLMVRATIRQRELAVRAALGAGRLRLVRQLLTESVVLAIAGGATGAAIGWFISGLLSRITLPADLPIRFDLPFDWRVFSYIAAVGLGTGIAVGLVPALRASRADLNEVLREGGRSSVEGGRRQRLRSLLVVGQVAVSLILLVAAGLFVRSVQRAQSIDLGFRPAHVLNLSMDVSQKAFDETRGRAFFQEVEARLRSLPGVELVSSAYSVPLGYYNASTSVEAEGQPIPSAERRPAAGFNLIEPDYMATMTIPIVRGRGFTAADDERGQKVAIVNEYMVERFWHGQDPIGRQFRMTEGKGNWLTVVGVTRTGKYSYLFEDPGLYFFAPIAQHYRAQRVIHVRTAGAPEALAAAAQREIREVDPDLPVFDVRSMAAMLEGPNGFFLLRMGALFGGVLGLLGLTLALVGIYGVVSYATSQRTTEIGIRLALGAQPNDVLRLVISQGFILIGAGIAIGLSAAFAVSRMLGSLLFGISSTDPITFVAVPLALGVMALLASYLPARHATRIDPIDALRK